MSANPTSPEPTFSSSSSGRAALKDRTAIVTGASSGIGRAIAERLGSDGASVHLLGRAMEPMEESVSRIEEAGGSATATSLDVRDGDKLAAFVANVADRAGRLDVMVNNAGLGYRGTILAGEPEDWREMLEVNVLALLVGCQAAVEAMRLTGSGGNIINISSIGALRTESGVYGATKAAVNYLTEGMRAELEGDDIRITSLSPGVVATNFVRHFPSDARLALGAVVGVEMDPTPGSRVDDEVLTAAQAALPDHVALPSDIAEAVAFVVGLPRRLNVPSLVVRPARSLDLPA